MLFIYGVTVLNKFTKKTISLLTALLLASALLPSVSFADAVGEAHNREWGFRHNDGIVLVLSGGGTKGLSHIGVFEVLERENIPVAAIVGTSMGAIMGGVYATGADAAEMRKMAIDANLAEIISGRSTYASPIDETHRAPTVNSQFFILQMDEKRNMKSNVGLLRPKNLYNFLMEKTAKTNEIDFDNLPVPFAAVATDLESGEAVVLRNGNLASALRASMSIPGVFDPWEINGRILVDGGIKANLPVKIAKELFPGHPVVAVNLSPKHIRRDRTHLRSLVEIAAQTVEILMMDQVRENVKEADVVINPDVSEFGVLDSAGYDEIMARGKTAAEEKVDEIKALMRDERFIYAKGVHGNRGEGRGSYIAELRFRGIPSNVSEALYSRYEYLIGTQLDMDDIAEIVKELSMSPEFLTVDAKIERSSGKTVSLLFDIERPAKFQFTGNGYVGNIHQDSWASVAVQIRDIMMDGDIGSLEYRLGNTWGAKGRYFTSLSANRTQFGFMIGAVNEKINGQGLGESEYERYSARAEWYKEFGTHARIGLGYLGERINSFENWHGPTAMLSFNNLDDPVLPTKGTKIKADTWFPFGEKVLMNMEFQQYLPTVKKWKLVLSGGFKMGDEDYFPNAAFLGNKEELYSLAKHPLYGDQAYWLHLGAEKTLLRSWWGGVNTEIFANYGQVLSDWDSKTSWWETGLELSLPLNNFAGRLFVVYDQEHEVTFGYSFGFPSFWNGPLQ